MMELARDGKQELDAFSRVDSLSSTHFPSLTAIVRGLPPQRHGRRRGKYGTKGV